MMPQTQRDQHIETLSKSIEALVTTRKLVAEGKPLLWCQANAALQATCEGLSLLIYLRSRVEPGNGKPQEVWP